MWRPVSLNSKAQAEDYGDLTGKYLLEKMQSNPELVAITSGTPTVFGFTQPRRVQAGKQFVDVGIAEETAVAMASGIAKRGRKTCLGSLQHIHPENIRPTLTGSLHQ